jgi:hypothetical protein
VESGDGLIQLLGSAVAVGMGWNLLGWRMTRCHPTSGRVRIAYESGPHLPGRRRVRARRRVRDQPAVTRPRVQKRWFGACARTGAILGSRSLVQARVRRWWILRKLLQG